MPQNSFTVVSINPDDATTVTPTPATPWRAHSDSKRIALVTQHVAAWNACVEVVDTRVRGSVVLALTRDLSAGMRGILLRDIERHLKTEIDEGLVVYLQPKEDKNALRKLRGVTVK